MQRQDPRKPETVDEKTGKTIVCVGNTRNEKRTVFIEIKVALIQNL